MVHRIENFGRLARWPALALAIAFGSPVHAQSPPTRALSSQEVIAPMPLGDVPGSDPQDRMRALATINPFSGQPQAVAEGEVLFRRMNCAYCHGFEAKGVMGPSLVSGAWRYGGTPVQVFRSISDGRPKGMPSWRLALPADSIWKIVAYLQSLGGLSPAGGTEAGTPP